jgi:hypothetical protein
LELKKKEHTHNKQPKDELSRLPASVPVPFELFAEGRADAWSVRGAPRRCRTKKGHENPSEALGPASACRVYRQRHSTSGRVGGSVPNYATPICRVNIPKTKIQDVVSKKRRDAPKIDPQKALFGTHRSTVTDFLANPEASFAFVRR